MRHRVHQGKLWAGATLLVFMAVAGIGSRLVAAQVTPTPAITSTPRATNTSATRLPTASPTLRVTGAPFILFTDVEPLFPALITLEVALDLTRDRVESASVRLHQAESGLDVTAQIDLTNPLAVAERLEVTYLYYPWLIDPATAPRLFSFVEVEWTIRLRENVTSKVISGFIFQDLRRFLPTNQIQRWRSVGGADDMLRLFSHNDSLALNLVQANSARVLTQLRERTGLDLRYQFVIYDPGYRFCEGLIGEDRRIYLRSDKDTGFYPCSVENALAIYRAQGYQVLERATQSLDGLTAQINERMIRDAYARLWRVGQPPAWFREGLFQLYEPRPQARALQLVREANRVGGLLSLPQLNADPAELSQVDLWRAQSYLLTLFLAARYGGQAPFEIANAFSDVYTFDAALTDHTGTAAAMLYAEWERWLLTDAAAIAVRWTPYIPTTPTPTNTSQPSPTRTPTSAIPTETDTPRPTYTSPPFSTFTPIPPRPTNTPRPAGSLRSPTPAPTPLPEGPVTTITRSPLLLVGVVALIVLVLGVGLGAVRRGRSRPS